MFKKNDLQDGSFVIAEVGQNHQGDLNTAREFIRIFAFEGADAIKFQTRNNKYLFSKDAYEAAYDSENAFAETYGAHREKLELKPEWLPILKEDCIKHGVKFMSTPFDEPSLDFLINLEVDILKIASFDLGNLPFINRISKSGIPTVLSIGGGKHDQIVSSINLLRQNLDDSKIAILHCVSEYPCNYDRLGLNNIEILQGLYPNILIGLSDHFNGTLSGPIGYMKGARIFEKHVTLNRSWKGTDHSFALEPEGFRKFVRDIERVEGMMSQKDINEIGKEKVFMKLGKSIVPNDNLKMGEILTLDNLSGKIFDKQYIPVRQCNEVLGKALKKDISKGEALTFDFL